MRGVSLDKHTIEAITSAGVAFLRYCVKVCGLSMLFSQCGCLFITGLTANTIADVHDKMFPDPLWKLSEQSHEPLELQQYGVAEQYCLRIIEESKKDKKQEWPSWVISKYQGLAFEIYPAQGRYTEAVKASEMYYTLQNEIDEGMRRRFPRTPREPNDTRLYHWRLSEIYLEQGKYDMALDTLGLALKCEYVMTGSQDIREGTLAQHDLYLGKCYLQMGEYEKARNTFQESLDLFLKYHLVRGDYLGRSQSLLGTAYFYLGEEVKAEALLRGSAELTLLARIAEHRGETSKALEFYYSALRAWRENIKQEQRTRTQQANALNQLGGFFLRQTNLEESSKSYHEAKALREATTTTTHPEYAVTMKGLAAIAVSRNELTSATLLAHKALDVLDASVVPTHARIAPVLVALASIETLNGHPEEAAKINQRLETLLQDRPLAIWKEDFLWTANFYAGVLDKAGKTPEAAALRQIHDRQRDRK